MLFHGSDICCSMEVIYVDARGYIVLPLLLELYISQRIHSFTIAVGALY